MPAPYQRPRRAVLAAAASFAMVVGSVFAAPAAQADSAVAPASDSFTIQGAGFGHGWGMSQYGAYGAALKGKTWEQILAFYYPGTTLATQSAGAQLRVWITADTDNQLEVYPASGLRLKDIASSSTYTLPTGSKYTRWRVTRSGNNFALSYLNTSGKWTTQQTSLKATATWAFEDTAKIIKIRLPGGSERELRGQVWLAKYGSGGRTVNRLSFEDYLKSVVPSEMPTSWDADAVRAQAVAARSYAARTQVNASSSAAYDICDTTSCQVYKGYATTSGGKRTVNETSGGNAAVSATSRKILKYGNTIAFTQFASSNGGASAQGDYPYLKAQNDPYDGVVKSQAWTVTIKAASVASAYPSVGTVQGIQITGRDGSGSWGGRVTSMKIMGTKGTVTTSGRTFQSVFGLRSNLFTINGAAAYTTFPMHYAASSRADLLVVDSKGNVLRYPATSGSGVGVPVTIGSGFGPFDQVIGAGDWNGDGIQDVIARTTSDRLLLFRGTPSGRLHNGIDMGVKADFSVTTALGDFNGDSYPDMISISEYGSLWLQLGDGKTGVKQSIRLAEGTWKDRDWMISPGDLTGDGRPDLVTRQGDWLYLHRGTKTSFASPTKIGPGWAKIDSLTTIGDFNNDKKADLIAHTRDDQYRLYSGNGKGGFSSPVTLTGIGAASVIKGTAYETFPRHYSAAGRADLLMINGSGSLVRYPVVSATQLGGPVTMASGFGSYDQVINAGDWNGDGIQDVIARTSSDRLLLFRGTPTGGLSAAVDMGVTADFSSTTSLGDFDGDSYPDIISISEFGNVWLQLGDGKTGIKRSIHLLSGWKTQDWLRSPGDLTGDGRPDLVTKQGDWLYLHRGTKTSFAAPTKIGPGWTKMASLTTIGDFTNDHKADLIARTASGSVLVYPGNGKGGFGAPTTVNGGYQGTRFAT